MNKVLVAILGSGNIATDLMYKIRRSAVLELRLVSGIDPNSEGLARARRLGLRTSVEGIAAIRSDPGCCEIVFDATSAKAHLAHAPVLKDLGKAAIDLTPAAVGPYVVPNVNLKEHLRAPNLNLTSCGGQATIPIVAAIQRVQPVEYAEIVATIASKSAGPGTRQNIDEFTETTAHGLRVIGGAKRSKAIIILNPAEPPILMRDTIYARVQDPEKDEITRSVRETVAEVQKYVPGYRLRAQPVFDEDRVAVFVEVEGAGDYLPRYSGNLDIMTSAAVRVGEEVARSLVLAS